MLIVISLLHLHAFSQSPKRVLKKIGDHPLYFIDSVNVDREAIQKHDAKDVASMHVLSGKEAKEFAGEAGKDGVIFVESIQFATKRYKRYFRSKSPDYEKIISNADNDTTIQYILNNRVLTGDIAGNLSLIDDKVFKKITILSKEALIKDYGITGKEHGVLIYQEYQMIFIVERRSSKPGRTSVTPQPYFHRLLFAFRSPIFRLQPKKTRMIHA